MPIYEYRCSSCGYEHEALQKMSADPLVDCPKCNAPSLVKLVSAAGFQLKGAGWYVTDFNDKKTKPSGTEDSKSSEDSKKSASSAAEKSSKEPALKTESKAKKND